MTIEVKISNKIFYFGTAFILLLVFALGVRAFGGSSPSTMGHSSGEVEVTVGGSTKTLQSAIDNGDFGGGFTNQAVFTSNGASRWIVPAGVEYVELISIGAGGGGGASFEGQGAGGGATHYHIYPSGSSSARLSIYAEGGAGGSAPDPNSPSRAGDGGTSGSGTATFGKPVGGTANLLDGAGGDDFGNQLAGNGAGGGSTGCNGGNGGSGFSGSPKGGDPVVAPTYVSKDHSGWGGTIYGHGGTGAGSNNLGTAGNTYYGGGSDGADGAVVRRIEAVSAGEEIDFYIGGGGGGGAYTHFSTWSGCGGGGANGVLIIRW